MIFMSWLLFKAQLAISTGELVFPEKEFSTDGCHYQFTPKNSPSIHLRLEPALNNTDILHAEY